MVGVRSRTARRSALHGLLARARGQHTLLGLVAERVDVDGQVFLVHRRILGPRQPGLHAQGLVLSDSVVRTYNAKRCNRRVLSQLEHGGLQHVALLLQLGHVLRDEK